MPSKAPLGLLILHGFTGSLDTVRAVLPIATERGLPHRMPVLRGHGTHYRDLAGATAEAWYADAAAALDELLQEAERVIVVGLSMGGLVALNLAADRPEAVAGLALVAPALRFANPLTPLTPLISQLFAYWPSPKGFNDSECERANTNYPKFATSAFASLLSYAKRTEARLGEISAPTLILMSHRDTVIKPLSAVVIEAGLASREKRVLWFERSGHEMLQDLEAAAAVEQIAAFVDAHRTALSA